MAETILSKNAGLLLVRGIAVVGTVTDQILRLGFERDVGTGLRPGAPSAMCSSSMDGNGAGAGLCMSFFCGPLVSTLDDGSVGFSTRRDDPSN